jgi:hypothetical protein
MSIFFGALMAPSMYHESEYISWMVKPRNLAAERAVEDERRRQRYMACCEHKRPGYCVLLEKEFFTDLEQSHEDDKNCRELAKCLLEMQRRGIDISLVIDGLALQERLPGTQATFTEAHSSDFMDIPCPDDADLLIASCAQPQVLR